MVLEFSSWFIYQSLGLFSYSSLRLAISTGTPPSSDGSVHGVNSSWHLNSDMAAFSTFTRNHGLDKTKPNQTLTEEELLFSSLNSTALDGSQ